MMYLLPKIYIQYAYVPLVKTSCTVHILVQKKGQKQSDKPCQWWKYTSNEWKIAYYNHTLSSY
jgi:hypothetical protein